jgi:hypothetical protein
LLVIILLTNISFAQADSTYVKNQIQFHLVNDYSVSYLKMFAPTSGLRLKVDLGLSGSKQNSDDKNEFTEPETETLVDRNSERDFNSQYVNLVLNYLRFVSPTDDIKIYYGAGPLLSFSRDENNYHSDILPTASYSSNQSSSEIVTRSFGIGLQLVAGIECPITTKLSLLAEFNLNGTYSWNYWSSMSEDKSATTSVQSNVEEGTSWNYGLNQLKLGIAYRF